MYTRNYITVGNDVVVLNIIITKPRIVVLLWFYFCMLIIAYNVLYINVHFFNVCCLMFMLVKTNTFFFTNQSKAI